ncbi:Stromal cell-derived factor 2-like protein 1 [Seminavis robusta]|uniref:Stromal cell-derived factor 2-like protein 1 n=1 Tax=Seminavis robusta TaxID=568900 RepID=A0A9N8EU30_9STRA|nr:Stromal cell-derived factor 2-like protein 1 [Seminavis robusta]|eukprot:Sro1764_g296080.1 Stromal cell-derived factor 2-like protein 1 (232) ;mRNA; f:11627-12429
MNRIFAIFVLVAAALHRCAADDSDTPAVTCGSAIKITHVKSGAGKYLLFDSEGKNRQGGSGQHLATWLRDDPSNNRAMWWIRPAHHGVDDTEYPTGGDASKHRTCHRAAEEVKCGDTIRLTNMATRRQLHSHQVKSPLSNQQEVSVYEGQDFGDDWVVECVESSGVWRRGETVRLKHVQTGGYLGASPEAEFNERTCGRNCPLMHHLESFTRGGKDHLSEIRAEQGIYLHI